ncbi:MAG: hypothetical protein QY325_04195 [Flavobacteriales bacterium]|nr:MAG: hypothetical protein QY325_04195 [Flavobacteriales bacterium]
MLNITKAPIEGTYAIHGITYAQLVLLRDFFMLGCERIQHGLADNGGLPRNEDEAAGAAFAQDLYLKLRDAARR